MSNVCDLCEVGENVWILWRLWKNLDHCQGELDQNMAG